MRDIFGLVCNLDDIPKCDVGKTSSNVNEGVLQLPLPSRATARVKLPFVLRLSRR